MSIEVRTVMCYGLLWFIQESLSVRSRSVTRSFLARFGTSRTPLRSPVRNVKAVPCVSSGSTPERYVLVQNVDHPSPTMAEIPTSKLPQAQVPRKHHPVPIMFSPGLFLSWIWLESLYFFTLLVLHYFYFSIDHGSGWVQILFLFYLVLVYFFMIQM